MMTFASDRLLAERREMRRDRIRLGVRVLVQAGLCVFCLWLAYGVAADGVRTHADLGATLGGVVALLAVAVVIVTRPWKP
jgi:hypothetical protein